MKNIFIVVIICITLTACEVQSSKRLIEVCATTKHIAVINSSIKKFYDMQVHHDYILNMEDLKERVLSRSLKQNLKHTGKYRMRYKECEFEQKSNSKKFKKRWG